MGVEPTCRAWEARILPMNYSREKGMTQGSLASFLVGVTGLEPMASWSRTKRSAFVFERFGIIIYSKNKIKAYLQFCQRNFARESNAARKLIQSE